MELCEVPAASLPLPLSLLTLHSFTGAALKEAFPSPVPRVSRGGERRVNVASFFSFQCLMQLGYEVSLALALFWTCSLPLCSRLTLHSTRPGLVTEPVADVIPVQRERSAAKSAQVREDVAPSAFHIAFIVCGVFSCIPGDLLVACVNEDPDVVCEELGELSMMRRSVGRSMHIGARVGGCARARV